MICVDINCPYGRSFLVSTWYRAPNSDIDLFNEWDTFFQKCDAESKILLLVRDLNCDIMKGSLDLHTRQPQFFTLKN